MQRLYFNQQQAGSLLRDRHPLGGDVEHAREVGKGDQPRVGGVDLRDERHVGSAAVLHHESRLAVVIDVEAQCAPQRGVETRVGALVDDPLKIEDQHVARLREVAARQRGRFGPRELVHRQQRADVTQGGVVALVRDLLPDARSLAEVELAEVVVEGIEAAGRPVALVRGVQTTEQDHLQVLILLAEQELLVVGAVVVEQRTPVRLVELAPEAG